MYGKSILPFIHSPSAKLGSAALTLAFVTLFTAGILTYRDIKAYRVIAVARDETQRTLGLERTLLSHMEEAETGQRGYLLTGGSVYLEPYNAALRSIPRELSELRSLAALDAMHDANLTRELTRLEMLIAEKLDELQITIDLRQSSGLAAALAVVETGVGRRKMDEIRASLQILQEGEEARWRAAWGELEGKGSAFRIATLFGIVILALLVGGAGLSLSRATARLGKLADDIDSARQGAERARDLLAATLRSIGDGVITTDKEGSVQMMNGVAQTLTGYSEAEAQGRRIEEVFRILNESTRKVVGNPVRRVVSEGRIVGLANHTVLVSRSGADVPIDDSAAPITESDGSFRGVVLVFRDVSERKKAEETALQLAAIVEGSDDAIIGATLDGFVTTWNHGAERLLGYSEAEIIGCHIARVFPPEQVDQLADMLAKLRQGEPIERLATWRAARDGRRIAVSVTASPIRDSEGHIVGIAEIGRDITRERQLEEMLRQTQKMEAIGRLAGGIAHDFNNLLTVILGYADMVRGDVAPGSPTGEAIREIVSAAEKASSLTGQLLSFSRRQVVQPRAQDLNVLIRGTENMLRRLIGEDIDFALVLDASTCLVNADDGQLNQVLMNLALNARDAMPGGGKLTIETHLVEQEAEKLARSGMRPAGRYVLLAVTDTGCGMTAEQQARIFEPFFTTKDPGKGTGLGLATVYGIVQQHGGWIDVYSEPEQGASFKVYLPSGGEKAAAPGDTAAVVPSRRAATILLVEDQTAIRNLAERALTGAGHRVLAAPGPKDALQLSRDLEEAIDLLITDVVMPDMSGPELASLLSQARPALAVLYISGYTDQSLLHRGVLEVGTAFLQKPFRSAGLIAKVEELLVREGRVKTVATDL